MGKNALEWIDFLHETQQRLWQILPLGPVNAGNCPYQCFSAFAGNPSHELALKLAPGRENLKQMLGTVLAALRDGASGGRPMAIAELRNEALETNAQVWGEVSGVLDELLQARIDLLFHRMWVHLGTAALLLMVILLLVYYVARQIARPLGKLAGVVERVSVTSDYSLRASWESQDEIGQLVRGFNHMLERLDYERVLEQQLASQAAAAEAQLDLLEAISLPMLVTSIPDHRVLHANAKVNQWIGNKLTDPWARGLESRLRARFFQRLADEGVVDGFEVQWCSPGHDGWALLSARRLTYQGQDAVLTTFTPIGQQKRMESRLQLWAKVFEATSEGIMVVDSTNHVVSVNAALVKGSGYHADELLGREPELLRSDYHGEDYYAQIERTIRIKGAWTGEFWMRRKNGEVTPQWMVVNTVRDEAGQPSFTITMFTDISEQKLQEQRIEHLAHHDVLTGLPNRLLFQERLRLTVEQADRVGHLAHQLLHQRRRDGGIGRHEAQHGRHVGMDHARALGHGADRHRVLADLVVVRAVQEPLRRVLAEAEERGASARELSPSAAIRSVRLFSSSYALPD